MANQKYTVELEIDDNGSLKLLDQGAEGFDGLGESAEDAGGKIQDQEKKVRRLGEQIVVLNQAAQLAVTAFGAMKGAAELANAGLEKLFAGIVKLDQLDEMSKRVGVSVESLSGLQVAAKAAGLEMEQVMDAAKDFSVQMSAAAAGPSDVRKAFERLGITVQDNQKTLLSFADALPQLARGFAQMEDGSRKTATAMQIGGDAMFRLLTLFEDGEQGLQRLIDINEKLGLTTSTTMANMADDAMKNFAIVGSVFDGIQIKMAEGMLPAINAMGNAVTKVLLDMSDSGETYRKFGEGFGGVMMSVTATIVKNVGDAFEYLRREGWEGFLKDLKSGSMEAVTDTFTYLGEVAADAFMGRFNNKLWDPKSAPWGGMQPPSGGYPGFQGPNPWNPGAPPATGFDQFGGFTPHTVPYSSMHGGTGFAPRYIPYTPPQSTPHTQVASSGGGFWEDYAGPVFNYLGDLIGPSSAQAAPLPKKLPAPVQQMFGDVFGVNPGPVLGRRDHVLDPFSSGLANREFSVITPDNPLALGVYGQSSYRQPSAREILRSFQRQGYEVYPTVGSYEGLEAGVTIAAPYGQPLDVQQINELGALLYQESIAVASPARHTPGSQLPPGSFGFLHSALTPGTSKAGIRPGQLTYTQNAPLDFKLSEVPDDYFSATLGPSGRPTLWSGNIDHGSSLQLKTPEFGGFAGSAGWAAARRQERQAHPFAISPGKMLGAGITFGLGMTMMPNKAEAAGGKVWGDFLSGVIGPGMMKTGWAMGETAQYMDSPVKVLDRRGLVERVDLGWLEDLTSGGPSDMPWSTPWIDDYFYHSTPGNSHWPNQSDMTDEFFPAPLREGLDMGTGARNSAGSSFWADLGMAPNWRDFANRKAFQLYSEQVRRFDIAGKEKYDLLNPYPVTFRVPKYAFGQYGQRASVDLSGSVFGRQHLDEATEWAYHETLNSGYSGAQSILDPTFTPNWTVQDTFKLNQFEGGYLDKLAGAYPQAYKFWPFGAKPLKFGAAARRGTMLGAGLGLGMGMMPGEAEAAGGSRFGQFLSEVIGPGMMKTGWAHPGATQYIDSPVSVLDRRGLVERVDLGWLGDPTSDLPFEYGWIDDYFYHSTPGHFSDNVYPDFSRLERTHGGEATASFLPAPLREGAEQHGQRNSMGNVFFSDVGAAPRWASFARSKNLHYLQNSRQYRDASLNIKAGMTGGAYSETFRVPKFAFSQYAPRASMDLSGTSYGKQGLLTPDLEWLEPFQKGYMAAGDKIDHRLNANWSVQSVFDLNAFERPYLDQLAGGYPSAYKFWPLGAKPLKFGAAGLAGAAMLGGSAEDADAAVPLGLRGKQFTDIVKAEYPRLNRLKQHLQPWELEGIANRTSLNTIEKTLESMKLQSLLQELELVAKIGSGSRTWYQQSGDSVGMLFDLPPSGGAGRWRPGITAGELAQNEQDFLRFTGMLGATSPQTSVDSNWINTAQIWTGLLDMNMPTDPADIWRAMAANIQTGSLGTDKLGMPFLGPSRRVPGGMNKLFSGGKPTTAKKMVNRYGISDAEYLDTPGSAAILDAWIPSTVRALTMPLDELLLPFPRLGEKKGTTNKTTSFLSDLANRYADDPMKVTGDTHHAIASGIQQSVLGGMGGYTASSIVTREVASRLGVSPMEAQAMIWNVAKPGRLKFSTKSGGTGDDLFKALMSGELAEAAMEPLNFSTLIKSGGAESWGKNLDKLEDFIPDEFGQVSFSAREERHLKSWSNRTYKAELLKRKLEKEARDRQAARLAALKAGGKTAAGIFTLGAFDLLTPDTADAFMDQHEAMYGMLDLDPSMIDVMQDRFSNRQVSVNDSILAQERGLLAQNEMIGSLIGSGGLGLGAMAAAPLFGIGTGMAAVGGAGIDLLSRAAYDWIPNRRMPSMGELAWSGGMGAAAGFKPLSLMASIPAELAYHFGVGSDGESWSPRTSAYNSPAAARAAQFTPPDPYMINFSRQMASHSVAKTMRQMDRDFAMNRLFERGGMSMDMSFMSPMDEAYMDGGQSMASPAYLQALEADSFLNRRLKEGVTLADLPDAISQYKELGDQIGYASTAFIDQAAATDDAQAAIDNLRDTQMVTRADMEYWASAIDETSAQSLKPHEKLVLELSKEYVALSEAAANATTTVGEQNTEFDNATGGASAYSDKLSQVAQETKTVADSTVSLGNIFSTAINQSLDAVINGTRSLGDVWKGMGLSLLQQFAAPYGQDVGDQVGSFFNLDPNAKDGLGGLGKGINWIFGDGTSGGIFDWWRGKPSYGSSFEGPLPEGADYTPGQEEAIKYDQGFGQTAGQMAAGAMAGYGTASGINEMFPNLIRARINQPGAGSAYPEMTAFIDDEIKGASEVFGALIGAVLSVWLGGLGGALGGALSAGIGSIIGQQVDRDFIERDRDLRLPGTPGFGLMNKLTNLLIDIPDLDTIRRNYLKDIVMGKGSFKGQGLGTGILTSETGDSVGMRTVNFGSTTNLTQALEAGPERTGLARGVGRALAGTFMYDPREMEDASEGGEDWGAMILDLLVRSGASDEAVNAQMREWLNKSGMGSAQDFMGSALRGVEGYERQFDFGVASYNKDMGASKTWLGSQFSGVPMHRKNPFWANADVGEGTASFKEETPGVTSQGLYLTADGRLLDPNQALAEKLVKKDDIYFTNTTPEQDRRTYAVGVVDAANAMEQLYPESMVPGLTGFAMSMMGYGYGDLYEERRMDSDPEWLAANPRPGGPTHNRAGKKTGKLRDWELAGAEIYEGDLIAEGSDLINPYDAIGTGQDIKRWNEMDRDEQIAETERIKSLKGPDGQVSEYDEARAEKYRVMMMDSTAMIVDIIAKGFADPSIWSGSMETLREEFADKVGGQIQKAFTESILGEGAGAIFLPLKQAEEDIAKLDLTNAEDRAKATEIVTKAAAATAEAFEYYLPILKEMTLLGLEVNNATRVSLGLMTEGEAYLNNSLNRATANDPHGMGMEYNAARQENYLIDLFMGSDASNRGANRRQIRSQTEEMTEKEKKAFFREVDKIAERDGISKSEAADLMYEGLTSLQKLEDDWGELLSMVGASSNSLTAAVGESIYTGIIEGAEKGDEAWAEAKDNWGRSLKRAIMMSVIDGLMEAAGMAEAVNFLTRVIMAATADGVITDAERQAIDMAKANVEQKRDTVMDGAKVVGEELEGLFPEEKADKFNDALKETIRLEKSRFDQWKDARIELGEAAFGVAGSRGRVAIETQVPALAAGGIVTRPTLALIGEAGPEAVIPLSSMRSADSDETVDELRQTRVALERLAAAIEDQPAQVDVSIDRQVLITAMTKTGRLARKAGRKIGID